MTDFDICSEKAEEMIGKYNSVIEDLNDAEIIIDDVEETALNIGLAVGDSNLDAVLTSSDLNSTIEKVAEFCNRTNDLSSKMIYFDKYKTDQSLLGKELKNISENSVLQGDDVKQMYKEVRRDYSFYYFHFHLTKIPFIVV